MSIAEAIAQAMNDGDLGAVAAAILAHPGSVELPRSALSVCGRVAFGATANHDDKRLIMALASAVLDVELPA